MARVNVQDGLRVDWPDRWFHVRVSQTEPILRVICEQRGEPPNSFIRQPDGTGEGTSLMAREHLLKIGVSGIRGVVGEFLTPGSGVRFRAGVRDLCRTRTVLVGRDPRATGPMLQHAVQCGLLAAGCEVVDLGVLPTPSIQMYIERVPGTRRNRAHRIS